MPGVSVPCLAYISPPYHTHTHTHTHTTYIQGVRNHGPRSLLHQISASYSEGLSLSISLPLSLPPHPAPPSFPLNTSSLSPLMPPPPAPVLCVQLLCHYLGHTCVDVIKRSSAGHLWQQS